MTERVEAAGTRTSRTQGLRGLIGIAAIMGMIGGCATGRVSNIEAYDEIAMNKVVPYPDRADLRKRAYELIVVDRPAVGIDASTLVKPRAQVRGALLRVAAEAGAAVIDQSLSPLGELRTEGVLVELEGRETEDVTGADFALATRFSKYQYSAEWKKPFKLLWQSEADVVGKPGICIHRAEVEVDIQLSEVGSDGKITKTYALEHSAEQGNKDLDPACTIAPVTLGVLFEKALDEALSCLNIPLGSKLLPRGHLTGHRKAPGAERHIYRISLGSAQGIRPGNDIEVRREQRSMSPSGEEIREERVIAKGVVTDHVRAQQSWVALDPTKATGALLEGDVVRPFLSDGLLASLSGPDCDSILAER